MVVLLFFESLVGEVERAAVLGDGAHDLIGSAVRDLGFYLQRDGDVGTDEPGEMGDHFVGDLAGVAADAGGVERYGTVKAL